MRVLRFLFKSLHLNQSFHRTLLEKNLRPLIKRIKGNVLDIGGRKRGNIKWHELDVDSYKTLDINRKYNPDIVCDILDFNTDEKYNTILLLEVIEHLEKPEETLRKISSLLSSSGNLIISTPFMFPIHADPSDFQRYTEFKLRKILSNNEFTQIEISRFGGPISILCNIYTLFCFKFKFLLILCPIYYLLACFAYNKEQSIIQDYKQSLQSRYPLGYVIICKKL